MREDRRVTHAVHWAHRCAWRMAADCERMLERLHHPDRKRWREAAADGWLAARHLLQLTAQPRELATGPGDTTRYLASLASQLLESQQQILTAMAVLLQFVPVSTGEELLLQDARAVRDMAAELLTLGHTRSDGSLEHRRDVQQRMNAASVTGKGKARVLVVDDEPAMRRLLERRLTLLGYEGIIAENGRRALAIASSEPVDAIVTDILMPEMGGVELLRLLKAGERTRDIPVIVVSGQGDLESVATCIEAGAEDHITKPYQPIVLDARLKACLERKRMRDLELGYFRRVTQLTSAAEEVERGAYVPGALASLAKQDDALGRLARVFDRLIMGLKSREDRLQRRLGELQREMGESTKEMPVVGQTPDSPFSSGEILGARYQVLGHLGSGGMGMVYRARDMELNEDVAVKVVGRDLVRDDPDVIGRLKSEIRLARRISHRNVVRTHDLGEWRGTYFITMEYVQGITVKDLLDRRGRLLVESTLSIGTQLCEALAVAHDLQIIHRDIKPANLMVDQAGLLKVMDFGIARSIEPDVDRHTAAGFIIGTPQYMSPEQLMGGAVDARSDLFAVGVVLYECLTGNPPFVADNPLSLIAHIVDGTFTPLSALVPDIPARLEAIVHHLLRLEASERIGSALELAHLLTELEVRPDGDAGSAREQRPVALWNDRTASVPAPRG